MEAHTIVIIFQQRIGQDMRLKGKVLELGENTACIDALSVDNISYISMEKPPPEKETQSVGCAVLLIVLSVIALVFFIAQEITSGFICFLVPLAVGIIWVIAICQSNSKTVAYNNSLKTTITIVMNSGKRFPLVCDPDKAPRLFEQLENCINSYSTGGGDFDLSNASKNTLPSDEGD